MIPLHLLDDNMLLQAAKEILMGNHWIAYNRIPYVLAKGDVYFFPDKASAQDFARENLSDEDQYRVLKVAHPTDFHLKVTYGYQLENKLQLFTQNRMTMNERNVEFLKEQLKYHGFGEGLQATLQHHIAQGFPEFVLNHQTQINGNTFAAALHFKKSDQTDRYYFNSWEAALKTDAGDQKQTFYVNHGQGITLKEGFNLMEGRPVQKELENAQGQKYKAWLQLDFKETDQRGNYKVKQYHSNYGYDLDKVLLNYPIKELKNETEKAALIRSLERGNRQSAVVLHEGKEQRVYLEAAPQFKSLNWYDAGGNRIKPHQFISKKEETLEQKQEHPKQTAKQKNSTTEETTKQSTKKSKNQKPSIS